MYLYVYDQNTYEKLIASGEQCLREMTDIHGHKIWVFVVNDVTERFGFEDGCIRSAELHMAF